MRHVLAKIWDITMLCFVVGVFSGAIIIPLCFHSKIAAQFWVITCNQIPERSFNICGIPMLICGRCMGIYIGYLIGRLSLGFTTEAFLFNMESLYSKRKHQIAYLTIILVALIEWYFSSKGIYLFNNWTRLVSGIGIGIVYARIIHGYSLRILYRGFT